MKCRDSDAHLVTVRTRSRHAGASIVALTAAISLGACAAPPIAACPAVGWHDTLTLVFVGDHSGIAAVEVCPEGTCISTLGDDLALTGGVLPTSGDASGGIWKFSVDMYHPEQLTVRQFDIDGAVITDTLISPEWERVDTDICGGPSNAEVMINA